MSLKERAASSLASLGVLRALENLPTQPGVLVFNHHRIGDREGCAYDRGLFSASAEQFEAQVKYIQRHYPVLLPHQLAEVIARKESLSQMHAMITFDDGYLDNYTVAYPILKRYGVPATFYLVSDFVGTDTVPWWDAISSTVRECKHEALVLTWCDQSPVVLGPDKDAAIATLVSAFKSDRNRDPGAALKELREESGVTVSGEGRRFLDWNEAREMVAGGMEIGAHTRTHPIISKLSGNEQMDELRSSKASIEGQLGVAVESFAYPNGTLQDFTPETKELARAAGYTTAFSFYGGVNRNGWNEPYDLLRVSPDPRRASFRLDAVLSSCFGDLEPTLRRAYEKVRGR